MIQKIYDESEEKHIILDILIIVNYLAKSFA